MDELAGVHPGATSGEVVARNDARWIRLRDQIQKDSLQTGAFKLASGRMSSFLFQLRQTTLHPEGSYLVADIIVDFMKAHSIGCIGGLALGAVPIVSGVAVLSHAKGAPASAFFVRKEAKEHGARERVDGFLNKEEEILLVDDVATSGGSILKALEGVKAESGDCCVKRALVVIDREEGARENLASHGIELYSIFKKSDFQIKS